MTEPSDGPVLKVSSEPAEAINEVALNELNRMHQRMIKLESENVTLRRTMAQMQESLAALWSAYNSNPRHQ